MSRSLELSSAILICPSTKPSTMLRASNYRGRSSGTEPANAKIFNSGYSSPSATLWTSPLVPPTLVGAFFGRGATNLKQLKSAFPALYIDFQKLHNQPELTGGDWFRFSLSRNTRNVLRWRPADDDQLDECRKVILECLNCPRYAFHTRLTHALPEGTEAAVWKKLSDEYAGMAAELDVGGPLYVLADAGLKSGQGADLNELAELLDTLDISAGGRKGKLRHHQAYTDSDLSALAARIATTYDDLTRVYTDRADRYFTLTATLGAQVFGHDFIRGQLHLALPTDSAPALPFKLSDLETALAEREVKPSFSEVFPACTLDKILAAVRKVGYTTPRVPSGVAAPAGVVEKVAVEFMLDQDYLDLQLKQSSLPGYTPRYEYKATFVYDADEDRFVLSEKGCRLRHYRIVRHTWVELANATSDDLEVPGVMPRLKFGISRPNDRPQGWDMANDLLAHLTMYVNANLATLRNPAGPNTLTSLPSALSVPLSQFRLQCKRVTSLASSAAAADWHVSVKQVTMWYRFNDPTGEVAREVMREKKWEVPERQPTFVAVLIADDGMGEAELEAGEGDEAKKVVEERVVRFSREVNKVAQAVREAVM
ncbi:hypothetical protein BCR44DRAFT_89496 [Catenaria anguillulae PL171]|uniref:Uncharacterized protein n=1 Tax=Catenaria anguillulae PL171 TaxID=765915 RepID=A0A1Y2HUI5_9FUNG|nr:hypothetical protein BCR44DRAFT_89496 [Catenaria anguillulae PL171]